MIGWMDVLIYVLEGILACHLFWPSLAIGRYSNINSDVSLEGLNGPAVSVSSASTRSIGSFVDHSPRWGKF